MILLFFPKQLHAVETTSAGTRWLQIFPTIVSFWTQNFDLP